MRFLCKIGIHDFEYVKTERRVAPKRGPFDPTTDEKRTFSISTQICCQCGKIIEYVSEGGYDL